ncbi:hypothetical protein IE81DRAFT_107059 [Ceraceosorus guamensis]|uniref:Dystroglycan-type cadherin-like domain-containing protein n=1 Tax=Ceraceosorus guamensis TaxID=1522189 RepID=A0A316VZ63_9BASI|nr:hypothetical protein IE81DRAFT_107059 [Ceraceosorus guamensis]PWN42957.1 hypothetical protein IE81DRAFT_107059 [Ceraceosorus guamensis]
MLRLTTLAVLANFASSGVLAAVTVTRSLTSQLPQIAHVGQPYTWTFAPNTLTSSHPDATIDYVISSGLPAWARFDAPSLTISGTPASDDQGQARIAVHGTERNGDQSAGASDSFNLLVLQEPAPTLNKALPDQLSVASSLGPKNILPGNKLHIPLGWSFSVGFDGNTFSLPDGSNVYTSAGLADGSPLPSWLTYDAGSYTMYGVAPTQVGPEGPQFDFVMTGSNREGYGGTTSALTIVVSNHALTLGAPLRSVNVTAGDALRYVIPTTGLQLDGHQSPPENKITIAADLSGYPFLTFDAGADALSGSVPFDAAQNDSLTPYMVPLTFRDTYNNSLPAILTLQVFPSPFVSETLPNIFVDPGHMFNQSLSTLLKRPNGTDLSAKFDPPSDWLSLDDEDEQHLLAGKPPTNADQDRVKVTLTASVNEGQMQRNSTATFYIAVKGDAAPTGSTGSGSSDSGAKTSGMTSRGQIALIASLASAGGLVALVFIMVVCRRCCAVEDHDTAGRMIDHDTSADERTLRDEKSPKIGAGGWKSRNVGDGASSYGGSPYLDPKALPDGNKWEHSPQAQAAELHSIMVSGGRGAHTPAMNEAMEALARAEAVNRAADVPPSAPDRVVQHSIMGAMPWAKKNRPRNPPPTSSSKSLHHQATVNSALAASTGSGLGLQLSQGDDPYTSPMSARHSRSRHSRHSAASSHASWESGGIFYENERDGADDAGSFEAPVRRGGPRAMPAGILKQTSPMRHRNSHINESPHFSTQQGAFPANNFGTRSGSEELSSIGHDQFVDSNSGPEADEPEMHAVEISQARRVDVRQVPRNVSSSVDPATYVASGAFEDAEDDELTVGGRSRSTSPNRPRSTQESARRNRDSVMSAGRPASITSSVMSTQGQPTMRMVQSGSPPPTPSPWDGQPFAGAASDYARPPLFRFATSRIQNQAPQMIKVAPEGRTAFTMHPDPPPQLRGAPDSPGKRSGTRRTSYKPLIFDESMPDFHGKWPPWMEWLHFDDRTFEMSGTPPAGLAETGLGTLPIALVLSTYRQPPSPALGSGNAPPSPGKRPLSAEGAEEDLEVVARADLLFPQSGPQVF